MSQQYVTISLSYVVHSYFEFKLLLLLQLAVSFGSLKIRFVY